MKTAKRPYYTLEFKQDAAKLVIEQGYTQARAAENLGVSLSALRRWINAERGGSIRSFEEQSVTAKPQLSISEYEELVRLRKENAKLKMEREILKKGFQLNYFIAMVRLPLKPRLITVKALDQ